MLFGQDTPMLERVISIKTEKENVADVLQTISRQTGIKFSYNPDIIKDLPPVSLNFQQKPIRTVLKRVLGEKIKFKVKGKYIILQKEKLTEKTKIIEGYINEPLTGRNVGQATVYDKNTFASAITDQYGYFRMEVEESDSNNVIMVSKAGQSDTILTTIPNKSQFVEVSFVPETKDTLRTNFAVPKDTAYKNSFFPQWLVSENLLINTFNLNDTFFQSVSLSVLPFVSTNRLLTGNSVNNISINLTVGYCQEIRMAEFGMVNIVRDNVRFVQLGYFGNIVGGHMQGYQASSIFNISNSLLGVQNSGFFNICQKVHGAQLASIFNKSDNLKGLQMAGMGNKSTSVEGAQVAGLGNITDTINGVQAAGIFNRAENAFCPQIAGFVNIAENNNKAQIAGFVNVADTARNQIAGFVNVSKSSNVQIAGILNVSDKENDLQIAGSMNIGGEIKGLQLSGLINIADKVTGTQVGIINIADSCTGVSIGIFNFIKNGYHNIELGYDETGFASFAFRTGVKRFYNILSIGSKVEDLPVNNWFYSYGLGTNFDISKKNSIYLELSKQEFLQKASYGSRVDLFRITSGINYQWKKNIAFTGALTINLMNHSTNEAFQQDLSKKIAPYKFFLGHLADNSELNSWIGAKVGIRFF